MRIRVAQTLKSVSGKKYDLGNFFKISFNNEDQCDVSCPFLE